MMYIIYYRLKERNNNNVRGIKFSTLNLIVLKQGLKSPQDNFYKVSPQQQYWSISNFIRFINPSLHIPSSGLWLLSLRISKMFVANHWMICQLLDFCLNPFPINIYLFKINNKISRKRSGMSSNLTLKTLETHH